MRLPLTIIAVAINIIIFVFMATFLFIKIEQSNPFFTAFLIIQEVGCILNTLLVITYC